MVLYYSDIVAYFKPNFNSVAFLKFELSVIKIECFHFETLSVFPVHKKPRFIRYV